MVLPSQLRKIALELSDFSSTSVSLCDNKIYSSNIIDVKLYHNLIPLTQVTTLLTQGKTKFGPQFKNHRD